MSRVWRLVVPGGVRGKAGRPRAADGTVCHAGGRSRRPVLIGDASSGCASRVGGELACERGAAVEDLPSVAGSGDKGGAVQHLEVLVWGAGSQPFSLRTRAAPP